MTTIANRKLVTFEDFCELVNDGRKADLIDGVIHMASPDNTDANDLFLWLASLLRDFVEVKDLGKVYGSRVAFRLAEHQAPEPDIAFVRKDHLNRVQRGYVEGPPDLAMEIVSPDSVERDHVGKRKQYQQARIPEYWIIDEVEERVILLRLAPNNRYREVRPRRGILTSEVVPGFWLRPEWLWQDPRPRKTEIFSLLLAE